MRMEKSDRLAGGAVIWLTQVLASGLDMPVTIGSKINPYLFLNDRLTEAELTDSRLCVAGMKTLAHMREHGGIKLTKAGAFNRRFVVWAVDEFQWPGYTADELYRFNKVLNEDDVMPLSYLHDLLRAARLIRRAKGKAILTKAGVALLGDHGRLQATLFDIFFTGFDFAAHERWPIEIEDADTFHFLGVIRNRLDDWVAYPEFASWCLPIYVLPAQRGTPEEDAMFYLATRLVRPLNWLGLVDQEQGSRLAPIDTRRLRKTALFDKFLRIEIPRIQSGTVH